MMSQVRVLMNPSPSMIADVTDDGVFGFDARQFFVIDLVRVLGYPVAAEHDGRFRICLTPSIPVVGLCVSSDQCKRNGEYTEFQLESINMPVH